VVEMSGEKNTLNEIAKILRESNTNISKAYELVNSMIKKAEEQGDYESVNKLNSLKLLIEDINTEIKHAIQRDYLLESELQLNKIHGELTDLQNLVSAIKGVTVNPNVLKMLIKIEKKNRKMEKDVELMSEMIEYIRNEDKPSLFKFKMKKLKEKIEEHFPLLILIPVNIVAFIILILIRLHIIP
jgi:hypothetical protein